MMLGCLPAGGGDRLPSPLRVPVRRLDRALDVLRRGRVCL